MSKGRDVSTEELTEISTSLDFEVQDIVDFVLENASHDET